MIGRLADVTVTLAAGLAIGWLISGSGKGGADVAPAQVPNSGTTVVLPTDRLAEDSLTDSEEVRCADITSSTEQAALTMSNPIPVVYRDMIGPLTEQTSRANAYDLYVAFARDIRDEPWAAAMEAGIANWSAGISQSAKMSIDYVQCRSHSCIIAGHSPTGDTVSLGAMRDQGWWQAEGAGMMNVMSGRDVSAVFLFFVARYADTNE